MNTSSVPACITTFQVSLHPGDKQVCQSAEDARRNFQSVFPTVDYRSHSAGPDGNFFALSWPTGKIERVKMATEIIESLWIYDDVVEAMPHSGAQEIHADVGNSLVGLPEKPSPKATLASLFKDFGLRLSKLDEENAPRVLASLKSYLDNYDSQKGPFNSIEEYTEYRILNVGFGVMEGFMQWVIDIHLDETEKKISRDFYLSSGRVMALTNDLYSWAVERTEVADPSTDRKWNAVPVVMSQYNMTEAQALVFVKGLIVQHEQETRRMGLELKRQCGSSKMSSYVESVELMLGGNCLWSSTCPRYNS